MEWNETMFECQRKEMNFQIARAVLVSHVQGNGQIGTGDVLASFVLYTSNAAGWGSRLA